MLHLFLTFCHVSRPRRCDSKVAHEFNGGGTSFSQRQNNLAVVSEEKSDQWASCALEGQGNVDQVTDVVAVDGQEGQVLVIFFGIPKRAGVRKSSTTQYDNLKSVTDASYQQ